MRARRFFEYGPASVLDVADVPEPHAGPGHIRVAVRASGVTPADWYLRSGRFRDMFPLRLPHVPGVDAAGVVGTGTTLLIEGAAGGVGTVAVQLAAARGATVIGTAGARNHEFVAGLGATPTIYGPGLNERVAALAPDGVDAVLDCAGSGSLPELVDLAGGPDRVVTIADLNAAAYGVHLSHSAGPGADPQAVEGLAVAATLAEQGRFTVPVAAAFPLKDAASAHELSETGHAQGKIVLTL